MRRVLFNGLVFLFFAPTFFLIFPSFTSYDLGMGSAWLLSGYVLNTLALLLGVGFLTFVFGVGSACVVTFLRFPGRNLLRTLLFFPVAVPCYIMALSYVQFFGFSSGFSTFLRGLLNVHNVIRINSIYGAIFVMSLSFYPYVYILCLARIASAGGFVAIARSCGKSFMATMLEVVIPIARPAIVGGITLVLMEVISDFGVMQFFGLQTFVTGIYRKWFLLNDVIGASRLILFLLLFVMLMLFLERTLRSGAFYCNGAGNCHVECYWNLEGCKAIIVPAVLSLLPLFALILPLISLLILSFGAVPDYRLFSLTLSSINVASIVSFLTVFIASFFVYMEREKKIGTTVFHLSNLGYSIPGLVVGIGVINFFANSSLFFSYTQLPGIQLFASGTFTALFYAYIFRFLVLGSSSIKSGIEKIPNEIPWTMKLMGRCGFVDTVYVYSPMLIRCLTSAVVLIFLDTFKELPLTLLVRPFNFETMSTQVYALVMDERYEDAAVPALIMTGICLFLTWFLTRSSYTGDLHNLKKGSRIGCLCDICLSKNGCSD